MGVIGNSIGYLVAFFYFMGDTHFRLREYREPLGSMGSGKGKRE
jgi:hypothetical protein